MSIPFRTPNRKNTGNMGVKGRRGTNLTGTVSTSATAVRRLKASVPGSSNQPSTPVRQKKCGRGFYHDAGLGKKSIIINDNMSAANKTHENNGRGQNAIMTVWAD